MAARAVIVREEWDIGEFAELLSTSYTTLMCAQALVYCNRLNAMLGEANARCVCLGGFCVRDEEDGYLLPFEEEHSNEKHGVELLRRLAMTLVMVLSLCPLRLLSLV